MDLAGFLLARIGEDEAVARAATPGPWDFADEHGLIPEADAAWCINQMRPGYEAMSETEGYIGDVAEVLWRQKNACPNAEHIARWDPARVLAECKAKRRIVAWCSQTNLIAVNLMGDPTDPANYIPGSPTHPSDAPVLRLLALPYADHPDYDESWRP